MIILVHLALMAIAAIVLIIIALWCIARLWTFVGSPGNRARRR